MKQMSDGIVPCGHFLNNDSPHNFSELAREFLDAAKFTHAGFSGIPMWPTYFLVFQSLVKLMVLTNNSPASYHSSGGSDSCEA